MKGIILAGGAGTRLYPLTKVISKQLLPIHDKPMIYYPLSILMLAGIKEILIISTPDDLPRFKKLLGNGESLGVSFEYIVQERPLGIAHAFILGEKFINNSPCALILGDNFFYGQALVGTLRSLVDKKDGATIFAYHVYNPEDYWVVEFTECGSVLSISEKPTVPKSNFAIPGLYFYDSQVVRFAKTIEPSVRGKLEITAINNCYLKHGKLTAKVLGRGVAWLDTGTHESLLEAGQFVYTLEKRQGLKIAALEEIAWRNQWIDDDQLVTLAKSQINTNYGKYLMKLIK